MEFDKQFRMDFAELPFYFQEIEKLKAKYASQITIKTALEIDFLPPYLEDRIFELPLDYRIGAVHFLGDWGFDNPEFIREYAKRDINVCWEQYFDAITQMAKTGKFDIVAHLDLLKIFNHRPTKDLRKKLEETLRAIKKANMAVEINAAGLRKEVKEQYPSKEIWKCAMVWRFLSPLEVMPMPKSKSALKENI